MAIQTLLKFLYVQPYRLRMRGHIARGQGPLIRKEPRVHLPIFSLVTSAVSGLGCSKGVLMNRLQREIEDDVFNLASADIVFFDLW